MKSLFIRIMKRLRKIGQFILSHLFYVILFVLVLILMIVYCFFPLAPFVIDNYRNILSACLQSVIGVFALIVTSLLLIFQLSSDKAPTSLELFPWKWFIFTVILLTTCVIGDGLALIMLQELSGFVILINLLLVLNLLVIPIVLKYVLILTDWMNPCNILKYLIIKAKEAETNQSRRMIISSIEELAMYSIQKGHITGIRKVFEIYVDLTDIFTLARQELNTDEILQSDPFHPLKELSSSITRITKTLSRTGLEYYVYLSGKPLGYLAFKTDGWKLTNVNVAIACTEIVRNSMDNSRDIQVYNFMYEFMQPLNSNRYSPTLTHCFDELLELGLKRGNASIVSDIVMCCGILINKFHVPARNKCSEMLRKCLEYPEILDKSGPYSRLNIMGQIQEILPLLNQ